VPSEDFVPRSLDLVVTSVAKQLMEETASTATQVTENVLAQLVEQMGLSGSFLRQHDHDIRASVLSHLKSLPVDMLKIDTGFVRDLGTNAGDLAIVRAIIGLAEAFGLQLVAEGVETPAAALTLMQHGCHRAQGFLLSRPVPGNAMEALLSACWMPMPFLADREALSVGAI
jgi:EAL domain-containing protein (putative c-di-GMP-specific phosphodiesterase class I)